MSYTAVCVVCILLCSLCDHYIITCAVVLVKSWSWPWNIKSSLGPNQKVLVLKNIEVLVLRPTVLVSKKCLIYITGCQCIFVLSFIFIFARSNVSKQSFNIVTTGLESMTDAFNHHGSAMHVFLCVYLAPLPSNRQHLSFGACLEDKREHNQNCSVLCCVRKLCTMTCTQVWAFLTLFHVRLRFLFVFIEVLSFVCPFMLALVILFLYCLLLSGP